MRKLILEEWVSLDGYAEDKAGKLDFFPSTEANKYSDEDQLKFLESIDTILLGRKTYELFVDFWPTATVDKEIIADKLNSLPKIVFSNSLREAPWGDWPAAEIMQGDLIENVKSLKSNGGKNMVMWGSISVAQSLMKRKLIDEYHIQVCPTVISGGRKLFADGDEYVQLKLNNLKTYDTGVVSLSYTSL